MTPVRIAADRGVRFGLIGGDEPCVEERPDGDRLVRGGGLSGDTHADAEVGSEMRNRCSRVLLGRIVHALPAEDVARVLERAVNLLAGERVVARHLVLVDQPDHAPECGRERHDSSSHDDAGIDPAAALVLGEMRPKPCE